MKNKKSVSTTFNSYAIDKRLKVPFLFYTKIFLIVSCVIIHFYGITIFEFL